MSSRGALRRNASILNNANGSRENFIRSMNAQATLLPGHGVPQTLDGNQPHHHKATYVACMPSRENDAIINALKPYNLECGVCGENFSAIALTPSFLAGCTYVFVEHVFSLGRKIKRVYREEILKASTLWGAVGYRSARNSLGRALHDVGALAFRLCLP